MNVMVYRKSGCPWAAAVMGFLDQLAIPYELKDVSRHEEYARELETKTGQLKSPSVEIDGKMIADAGVEDVAAALEERGVAV